MGSVNGLNDTDSDKIKAYEDVDQIAEWAYEEVKKTVGAGIFVGRTERTIDPEGTLTYAKAAVSIRNLLVAAGLINHRQAIHTNAKWEVIGWMFQQLLKADEVYGNTVLDLWRRMRLERFLRLMSKAWALAGWADLMKKK